jgi:hypothetical protein
MHTSSDSLKKIYGFEYWCSTQGTFNVPLKSLVSGAFALI